jgi:cell division protein FtsI (penicillin-binding protein 3)
MAFTRFMLVVAVLVLWIGGISVRLVHLQVRDHDWLKQRAEGQRTDVKRSKLPRGTIYDRNGRVLAMSVTVKTLYADPTEMDDLRASAHTLSKATGLNENALFKQLSEAKDDERRFLPLVKGLDDLAAQEINRKLEDVSVKKADLPRFAGLHWRDDQKRSYPNQTLASHVIGFSNAEGVGQAGIEQSQNELLYGAVIKTVQERDRLGRVYDETVSEKEPPSDIVLTISAPIQYRAEQALATAVRASNARSGMAIVIANRTGEVLALANYPSFDPNKLNDITADNLTNSAIQSIYSPGSVFKVVTYGSALEKGLITPEGEVDSGNGTIEIAKHKFTDSHAIGRVSYAEALAHSSNVCAIKTGMRVGREDFYSMIRKMGFGRATGIELPAETSGMVRPVEKWYGDSLASMSIGYEIGVSALQIGTAFATIANGGTRIQPRIIKEIRRSGEQPVAPERPEPVQVVSAATARSLKTMLRQVVLSGTGRRAQLDGFTSAGKTGTAWKFDPQLKRINSSKYISSFVGFAPAENPEVTIAVVMDEPKSGARDGGGVAAPVFREIAEGILPELGVHPDSSLTAMTRPQVAVPEVPDLAADADGSELPSAQPEPSKKGSDTPKKAAEPAPVNETPPLKTAPPAKPADPPAAPAGETRSRRATGVSPTPSVRPPAKPPSGREPKKIEKQNLRRTTIIPENQKT